MSENNTAYCLK